jgi:uncharacterized alkaline shock family protein YloU
MTTPSLTVGRPVLDELVRLAALEVSGVVRVGRVGMLRRAPFSAPAVVSRVEDGRADVWISIVARPGRALVPLTRQVRATVSAAIERLVGLQVGVVDVFVDGVGA